MNAGKPYARRAVAVEMSAERGAIRGKIGATNTKRPRRCVNTVTRGLIDWIGVD